jgi:hypothetical protein
MKKSDIIKILKGAKMQYAYNKDTRIYSAKFFIELPNKKKEERIFTMRVSKDFLEYSIADAKGNVLEMIKQEGSKLGHYDFRK